MATPEQKAFCVLQLAKHESVVSVQRAFRRQFESDFQMPIALSFGISSFRQRGAFVRGKVQDVLVSEENVEPVRQMIGLHFQSFSEHPPHSHSRHLQLKARMAHTFLRTAKKNSFHSFHIFFRLKRTSCTFFFTKA
jgi:hypothetical protein